MPPVRTMPVVKPPAKTERSHEENQERAYIAASRRSDRSLEARVESARRASEIHEKRTGRKLRVTEQDVINEEMYEEEDDNIPWRYRHLALLPNLSTLSPEFRRRVEAQLVLEMERSRMVDPTGRFQQPQYMNPGMMQMPQSNMNMFSPSMFPYGAQSAAMSPQNAMFPPASPSMAQQAKAGMASKHRQSPYPMLNAQQRPSPHHRSASIANPQELSIYQQQHPQSESSGDRRMSLPPQGNTPRNSESPNLSKAPKLSSSASVHTPTSDAPTPPMQGQSQFPRHYSYAGPSHTGSLPSHTHNPYAPLTPTLPINTQQILGDGMFNFMDDLNSPMLKSNPMAMNQPIYNYNPNMNSKKRTHDAMSASTGLDQTLMAPALDTTGAAQQSADSGFLETPSTATDSAFGLGFQDDGFSLDAFNSSGHATPEDFNSFVNDDFFGDSQYAF